MALPSTASTGYRPVTSPGLTHIITHRPTTSLPTPLPLPRTVYIGGGMSLSCKNVVKQPKVQYDSSLVPRFPVRVIPLFFVFICKRHHCLIFLIPWLFPIFIFDFPINPGFPLNLDHHLVIHLQLIEASTLYPANIYIYATYTYTHTPYVLYIAPQYLLQALNATTTPPSYHTHTHINKGRPYTLRARYPTTTTHNSNGNSFVHLLF